MSPRLPRLTRRPAPLDTALSADPIDPEAVANLLPAEGPARLAAIRVIAKNNDPAVRQWAVELAADQEGASGLLRALMRDKDPDVSIDAMQALIARGENDKQIRDHIGRKLRSSDEWTATAALWAIVKLELRQFSDQVAVLERRPGLVGPTASTVRALLEGRGSELLAHLMTPEHDHSKTVPLIRAALLLGSDGRSALRRCAEFDTDDRCRGDCQQALSMSG